MKQLRLAVMFLAVWGGVLLSAAESVAPKERVDLFNGKDFTGWKLFLPGDGGLMNEATECTVSSGKICIQSEGSEIEIRKVFLEPAS